jgi:CMP-N,N'-diacetyllegionaminic acid synthase
MNVIGIITARSGSKSVPHKNIRILGKVPLLGWLVRSATKSMKIDKLILSTDSEEYFNKAKSFNKNIIFHKRSLELSEDVPSELVILDVLKKYENLFDDDSIVVVLQPTTPFITSNDIDSCIEKLQQNSDFNTCITVKRVSEYPEWMIIPNDADEKICKVSPDESIRQNLQQRWIPNGGAYVVRKKFLEKTKSIIDKNAILIHEMSKIRSMDIDEEEDFQICEAIVNSNILID